MRHRHVMPLCAGSPRRSANGSRGSLSVCGSARVNGCECSRTLALLAPSTQLGGWNAQQCERGQSVDFLLRSNKPEPTDPAGQGNKEDAIEEFTLKGGWVSFDSPGRPGDVCCEVCMFSPLIV